jgi:hypothetical protein
LPRTSAIDSKKTVSILLSGAVVIGKKIVSSSLRKGAVGSKKTVSRSLSGTVVIGKKIVI